MYDRLVPSRRATYTHTARVVFYPANVGGIRLTFNHQNHNGCRTRRDCHGDAWPPVCRLLACAPWAGGPTTPSRSNLNPGLLGMSNEYRSGFAWRPEVN